MASKTLNNKGYNISISGWVGRLGNHLVQISSAIWLAQKTESKLTIPKHDIVRRRVFDFRNTANDNCNEIVEGRFLFAGDCFQYPIMYDQERRKILQDFLYKYVAGKRCFDRIQASFGLIRPSKVGPDTLVINMRSGRDIFRETPPPQNDYMQPPLSFYKNIISANDYDDCLIVTESDRANPVIAALVSWNPKIRLKRHISVKDDINTLLGAHHLVLAHSSFSWCLALMSRNLRVLHQPESFTIRGVDDFEINTYQIRNYIEPGHWTASSEQMMLMLDHSEAGISKLPCNQSLEREKTAWL